MQCLAHEAHSKQRGAPTEMEVSEVKHKEE